MIAFMFTRFYTPLCFHVTTRFENAQGNLLQAIGAGKEDRIAVYLIEDEDYMAGMGWLFFRSVILFGFYNQSLFSQVLF